MPADARLPIIETITGAWRDGLAAMRAMPVVLAIAVAIVVMMAVGVFLAVEMFLLGQFGSTLQMMASWRGVIFNQVSSLAQIVFYAPLMIAVQRYVLLGEAAQRYPLGIDGTRYLRFIGFAILFSLLFRAPDLINLLLPDARLLPRAVNIAAVLASVALSIAVGVVALRRLVLFPAIATDAPGATWRQARQATLGHTWRVFAIVIGTMLPGALAVLAVHLWMPAPHWPNGTGQLVVSVSMGLVQLPMLCALAAATARIYRVIGAPLSLPPAGMSAYPAAA